MQFFKTATARWSRVESEEAASFLDANADVAAVCGRLRERYRGRSIYNWLCDREWDRPAGEVRACAGNVMMRANALCAVEGYREDVIAAEEDELCIRLRAKGWRIWRLATDMALHDASITHFGQWWRRALRSGYGFAQGSPLAWSVAGTALRYCGIAPGLALGGLAPAHLSCAWIDFQSLGLVVVADLPLADRSPDIAQLRLARRSPIAGAVSGTRPISEGLGQVKFMRDRLGSRRPGYEYK